MPAPQDARLDAEGADEAESSLAAAAATFSTAGGAGWHKEADLHSIA